MPGLEACLSVDVLVRDVSILLVVTDTYIHIPEGVLQPDATPRAHIPMEYYSLLAVRECQDQEKIELAVIEAALTRMGYLVGVSLRA